MKDYKAYLRTLPQKRMGAGALFFDEHGRVLLVNPTYKAGWEIPGGVVEEFESPRRCCQREVADELGVLREVGPLLLVDYNSETATSTESVMFIFEGGVLDQAAIDGIKLPADELSRFAFFTRDLLPAEISEGLRSRILRAWDRVGQPLDLYSEDGI